MSTTRRPNVRALHDHRVGVASSLLDAAAAVVAHDHIMKARRTPKQRRGR
jgi:hypothetical protein